MVSVLANKYRNIVAVGVQTVESPGELPKPQSLKTYDLISGQLIHLDCNDLRRASEPPFPVGRDTLVVAYDTIPVILTFRILGWPIPDQLLDLKIEIRRFTNGIVDRNDLETFLDALTVWNIRPPESARPENQNLLALIELLGCLQPTDQLLIRQALLRSQYVLAAAQSEILGIPVNRLTWRAIKSNWKRIRRAIMRQEPAIAHLFVDDELNVDTLLRYAVKHGVRWPVDSNHKPIIKQDTQKDLARAYPAMKPVYQIIWSLNQMRSTGLTIGEDGRNRSRLLPFRSVTGRTQFSTAACVMGYPKVFRHLIQPPTGWSLVYIDYRTQEIGIGAVLSGDTEMIAAYQDGDFYIGFARRCGAVPDNATKKTHRSERNRYKLASLALGYGMGNIKLAAYTNTPPAYAREIRRQFEETFHIYHRWSNDIVNQALLDRQMKTRFGWKVAVTPTTSIESIRNWMQQSTGAEMIRLAHMLAMERGVQVLLPVHDALLIQGPTNEINEIVKTTQQAMRDASGMVLEGFALDAEIEWQVDGPNHYASDVGGELWSNFTSTIEKGVVQP